MKIRKLLFNRYVGGVLLAVTLFVSWYGYRLIWGKPININHFYVRIFIEYALDDPQMLTALGMIENTVLDFHSDELSDVSPAFDLKWAGKARENLDMLRSYDPESMTDSQKFSTRLLEWYLAGEVENEPYLFHNYPVNQLFGVQNGFPSFMASRHQIVNLKSAGNYISRLNKVDLMFDQVVEGLVLREGKGIIPPKFVFPKVLSEMQDFVDTPVEDNILYRNLEEKLEGIIEISEEEKTALLVDARSAITDTVYPAYDKLIEFMTSLEDKATSDHGVWKFPDGDAFYAHLLKEYTTTDMTPEEIHELGWSEIRRIELEMDGILKSLGYQEGVVGERMQLLRKEPIFLYENSDAGRTQALADYQSIIDEVNAGLGNTFNIRPGVGVEVTRVPEFREKTAPRAYYQTPPLGGAMPGRFFVNLRDVSKDPKWGMRTLAYHEAIPGHHFQKAIQQELTGLPTFRQVLPFTAYVEGWALYAEQLAWELGFQDEPYNNLGRLQAELFRAVRLVVDTGIHYKHWTRERAIDTMLTHTGMVEEEVIAEIERYIVMPGQACSYKVGMLKILELRTRAKEALGDQFDLAEFHDVVLKNGAVPLVILEDLVDEYIEEKKTA